MNVVFVIGGHGSGKTTAVRAIMGTDMTPIMRPGRKHPLGYHDKRKFVLGHYAVKMGGADTVRPLRYLHSTCHRWALDHHVVLEGIGQAGIAEWVMRLLASHGGAVLHITTPLEVCIASVRARGHTLSDEGVRVGYVRAYNIARKMEERGFTVHRETRDTIVSTLRRLTK